MKTLLRRSFLLAGHTLVLVSLGGCGEEATDLNQTGGAAGTGGAASGGASGASAGTAGSAAQTGGTGGSAGTATSGAGGTAGSAAGGSTSGGTSGTSGTGGGAGGGSGGSAGSSGTSGGAGDAGSTASGGSAGDGTSGSGGTSGDAGSSGTSGTAGTGGVPSEPFSFFLTSLEAVRRESGNENGFGGDLGGLAGADEICTRIAESSMPGSGAKIWRAFLSTTTEDAIDRVGEGPWYDRTGRLIAENIEGLLNERPDGDPTIVDDLPNETGVPNRAGTGTGDDDNHDTITGSDTEGRWDGGSTCEDWTSAEGSDGPRIGHSWPAGSGEHWIEAHTAPGCEPSVNLVQMGGGSGNGIGNGGGYGGFYCFALSP